MPGSELPNATSPCSLIRKHARERAPSPCSIIRNRGSPSKRNCSINENRKSRLHAGQALEKKLPSLSSLSMRRCTIKFVPSRALGTLFRFDWFAAGLFFIFTVLVRFFCLSMRCNLEITIVHSPAHDGASTCLFKPPS